MNVSPFEKDDSTGGPSERPRSGGPSAPNIKCAGDDSVATMSCKPLVLSSVVMAASAVVLLIMGHRRQKLSLNTVSSMLSSARPQILPVVKFGIMPMALVFAVSSVQSGCASQRSRLAGFMIYFSVLGALLFDANPRGTPRELRRNKTGISHFMFSVPMALCLGWYAVEAFKTSFQKDVDGETRRNLAVCALVVFSSFGFFLLGEMQDKFNRGPVRLPGWARLASECAAGVGAFGIASTYLLEREKNLMGVAKEKETEGMTAVDRREFTRVTNVDDKGE